MSRIIVLKRTASANTVDPIDIFEDMASSYQGLDDVALYKAAKAGGRRNS